MLHFAQAALRAAQPATGAMADKEENRFAHLLQPIRDLQANWHTDIAAELSDYLTQLEDITFSFDGGNTSLNFAEGARRGGRAARRAGRPGCEP